MHFLAAFVFLITAIPALASTTALTDVEIRADWVRQDAFGLASDNHNLRIKLSACPRSVLTDPALQGDGRNFGKCDELAYIDEHGTQSAKISALSIYHDVKEMGFELSDAVLLVSLWNANDFGAPKYMAHEMINPLDLKGAGVPNVIKLKGAKAASEVSLSFSVTDIDPDFADLNPPASLFQKDVIAAVTGRPLNDLKLSDYLWSSVMYYVDKNSPVWKEIGKGFVPDESEIAKNADFTRIRKLQSGSDLRRALAIYSQNYGEVIRTAQARLEEKRARAQQVAQTDSSSAKPVSSWETSSVANSASGENLELQRQQTEALKQQAEYMKQQAMAEKQEAQWAREQQNIQNSQAAIGLIGMVGHAVSKSLR